MGVGLKERIERAQRAIPVGVAVVGIDPGANGGMCGITREHVSVMTMPKDDEASVLEMLKMLNVYDRVLIGIEDVPKWCGGQQFARKNIFGASMAVLHGNFKLCQGICMGLGYEVEKILPMSWQKEVGARENGWSSQREGWKNHLKEIAQSMTSQRITLATADAVLIAASKLFRAASTKFA